MKFDDDKFFNEIQKSEDYPSVNAGSLVPITNWEEFAKQPVYKPYVPLQWIDVKELDKLIDNVYDQIIDDGLKTIGVYNSQFFRKDDEGDE